MKGRDKQLDPLFPILHINDAGKGGPKGPPRNKMALGEHYSPSSQSSKITSLSMPMRNVTPHSSLSHASFAQKKVFPKCNLPGSSHLKERYSYYPSRVSLNTGLSTTETAPRTSRDLMISAECSLFPGRAFSSYKELGLKSGQGGRMFKAPSFDESKISAEYGKEKRNSFSSMSLENLQIVSLKLPQENLENQTEENSKVLRVGEQKSVQKKVLSGAALSNLDQDKTSDESTNVSKKSCLVKEIPRPLDQYSPQEHHRFLLESKAGTDKISTRKRTASMEDLSHSSPLRSDSITSFNKLKTMTRLSKIQDSEPPQDEKQDVSEIQMPGGRSSPDDVAEVLGQKLFWKAKRTIEHQQRIFAGQIFELHRMIKVQRLIAGSQEMLHENKSYIAKPPFELTPTRANALDLPSKPIGGPKKSRSLLDHGSEGLSIELPIPMNNVDEGLVSQQSTPKPTPILTPAKFTPWCFQLQPGNQWLVPVRSPSEGLVYKPYTGPCPPNNAIRAPIYGPISLNTTAYQQEIAHFSGSAALCPSYFKPYTAMPVINASVPSEEVDPFKPISPAKHASTDKVNFGIPYHLSCNNLQSRQRGVFSDRGGNLNHSKGSDLKESMESSPQEHIAREAHVLSLFPTTPTLHVSPKDQSNEQQVQVIKVVPHDRVSASESAARIFQSIQEERKKA